PLGDPERRAWPDIRRTYWKWRDNQPFRRDRIGGFSRRLARRVAKENVECPAPFTNLNLAPRSSWISPFMADSAMRLNDAGSLTASSFRSVPAKPGERSQVRFAGSSPSKGRRSLTSTHGTYTTRANVSGRLAQNNC